ncbi:acyl-CoA thioesterase [Gilvimarinus sp. F26214L]|uniref:acyl-CoA thioesterase n=1 Tax=Gilvimarinus sp. DZF01 TaxID=3461371 RepID=UPI004046043D
MPSFSEMMDSAVLSDTGLHINITEDWLQGRTVYGGMQAAIAVQAMRQRAQPDAALRSVQITFVGPVGAGEVDVTTRLLRQGKSAGQVQAEIVQGGALRLIAVGIFARDRVSQAFLDPAMPPATPLAELAESAFVPEGRPAFLGHFESRIAAGDPLFSGSDKTDGIIYVRHRGDTGCSEAHLTALADLPPPMIATRLREPAPNSSMNWQLDFVRTPDQLGACEWFRIDAQAIAAENGYSWQNGSIWTEKGELVMLSRQCMAVFG